MTTASGDEKATRRPVMPYVAYAVVLTLLAGTGVAFWARERGGLPGLPKSDLASPPVALAPPIEPSRPAPGLKLPPRPEPPAASAPVAQKPAQAPAPSPVPIPSASPSPRPSSPPAPAPTPSIEASTGDAAAAPPDKPAPPKTRCTVDGAWPAERTDQGKTIQTLLRDLGFYDGTLYGTVGPTTRAAIRKFQLAGGQAETGEPDEALFESLKKKCVSPAP
jgi:hypothetical protein